MLRRPIASIAALFVFLWSFTAAAATPIKIAELNWAGSSAGAYVLKAVLEEYLDAEVEVVGGDEIALFEAMAKGDGAIDVFSDFWSIYLPAQWERYVVPGIVKVNAKPYLGTEGLFVPGYVQDALGLTRIEQLADPEMSKHFDTDGDGKGEMWTGAPGWQSVDEWAVKAKSMGFADHWTPTTVETWVMESLLDAAYTRKKPFIFYSYQPEWIHAAYDLRQVEEPPFDGFASESFKDDPRYNPDGCYHFVQASEDPDWFEKSSITCAKATTDVYVAYSAALSERAPAIAQFLAQVAFSLPAMSDWIRRISNDEEAPEDVAAAWMEANRDLIENEWLAGIAR